MCSNILMPLLDNFVSQNSVGWGNNPQFPQSLDKRKFVWIDFFEIYVIIHYSLTD